MSEVNIEPGIRPILNLFSQGTIIENHVLYTNTVIQTLQMQINNYAIQKNAELEQYKKLYAQLKEEKDLKNQKK